MYHTHFAYRNEQVKHEVVFIDHGDKLVKSYYL